MVLNKALSMGAGMFKNLSQMRKKPLAQIRVLRWNCRVVNKTEGTMPSIRSFGHKKTHKHDRRNAEILAARENRIVRRMRFAKAANNLDLFATLARQMRQLHRKRQSLGLMHLDSAPAFAEF